MSMLSLQAGKLRKCAERLRQLASGAVNLGFPARSELFASAAEMCGAADTIESLRDRLQEMQDVGGGACENVAPDYLDFLCSKCGFVHYHSDENDTGDGNDWNYCPQCGKAVKR